MKETFKQVRKMLEEHLAAINDNTGEIQVLFDYLQEMETKVEKLCQRLDNLQLSQNTEKFSVAPLSHPEKKVFLVLYTEEIPQTFSEISQKTNLSPTLIQECITTLGDKGVPLQRNFSNGQFFFSLNKQFKELQAKENLVNISLQSFM